MPPAGKPFRASQVLAAQASILQGAGPIAPRHIVVDHPVGVEEWSHGSNRRLHHRYPAARQTVLPAIMEQRHNFLLEQVVYGATLDVVLVHQVRVLLAGPNRPTIVARIAFAPPAVEDAQVQTAITGGFHTTGPRRFQRPARCIQPETHTLHQVASNVHILVFLTTNFSPKT